MKKIEDVMTRDVEVTHPDQTIAEAAALMAEADVGSLPVERDGRFVGMLTDRDIVVRAIAEGRDGSTPVGEVMTEAVKYCYDDQDVAEVAANMAELGVRRLPVVDRDKRLVGFVSLGNITQGGDADSTDTLLRGVATPH